MPAVCDDTCACGSKICNDFKPALLKSCNNAEVLDFKASPGVQLEAIVTDVMPHAPGPLQSPLAGLLEFIKANLNGVNTLLAGTLQGTADLLQVKCLKALPLFSGRIYIEMRMLF